MIPSNGSQSTSAQVRPLTQTENRPQFWQLDNGTPLVSVDADLFSAPTHEHLATTGWTQLQAQALLKHLGREAFHGARTRDFSKAYHPDPVSGEPAPRYYRVGTKALTLCQYVKLTHPSRSAVLVIDIDTPSHTPGGTIETLHPEVRERLDELHQRGRGPAWVGVNPLSGKAQALWLIDPVFAAPGSSSPNTRLLKVATDELNHLLGGDRAFSHHFSRWPLHHSDDPTAYRWHCQHSQIVRLADLVKEARAMTGREAPHASVRASQYSSGRERIQAARDAAAAARSLKELNAELPDAATLAPAASGVIDGVRVLWISPTRAARDETAFRHALATAHRLRAERQPLKDAKLIDAYERAYNLAQSVGADGREPDMPPMRDRLTMARRVRGYAIRGVTDPSAPATSTGPRLDSAGRKALATLGRRGGQQAAKRWNDPATADYQAAALAPLAKANQRRKLQSNETRGRILAFTTDILITTDVYPTRQAIATEIGVSIPTVDRHLAALRKAGLLP